MTNRVELRDYIRYQLSQLGARNAEHEFEALAFELARRRQVSNLQIATGPVKAGGDQGRDFESYHTYLAATPIGRSTFSTLISNEIVVGACTLDKKTPTKIRADLKTIFASGDKPDRVIYYCEPNLAVAARHKLKEECATKYQAKLDIFDGLNIADMLSDPDTFWIAEQYLNVPNQLAPEADVDDDYQALKKRWLTDQTVPFNYADFLSIKAALRTASVEEAAMSELTAWLGKISFFLADDAAPATRHRTRYEVCMAEMKGRKNLDAVVEHLRAYFDEIDDFLRQPSDLLDAAVLTSFSWNAVLTKNASLPVEELKVYTTKVLERVKAALVDCPRKVDRLAYMEALATIQVWDDDIPGSDRPKRAVETWIEIIKLARDVPHYPMSPIDRLVNMLAPMLADLPEFAVLRDESDKLLQERAGNRVLSEKGLERALTQFKAGHLLATLDELHRAKVGAFTGAEVQQAIVIMLMLGEIYSKLGLHLASRYYNAGAVFMALNSSDEDVYKMMPQAAFALAQCHYSAGEGASYVQALGPAMVAHTLLADDPGQMESHESLEGAIVQTSITHTLARRFVPALTPVLDAAIATWPFDQEFVRKHLAIGASPKSPWASMSFEELENLTEKQLGHLPFEDLGAIRTIHWAALGIDWSVSFPAEHSTMVAVHGLVATLQVVQAELARQDLNIIPVEAEIRASTGHVSEMKVVFCGDNDTMRWQVILPRREPDHADIDATVLEALTVATTVIGQATALAADEYGARVKALLASGLKTRIFSVRPAEELMDFTLAQIPDWEKLAKIQPPKSRRITPKQPTELAWRTGPGPGYSAEKAKTVLGNRYRKSMDLIALTWPKLMADKRARALLLDLRRQGYLDWQILSLASNLVVQYQVERSLGGPMTSEDIATYYDRFNRGELPTDAPFDLTRLTAESLQDHSRALIPAICKTWGLTSHVDAPVFAGLKRLLDERYGNSTDDVPHEDPFNRPAVI